MTHLRPVPYRVVERRRETRDTVTLALEPVAARIADPSPGQFTMMYAWGVGEVPVSVSGGAKPRIEQTVRAVGAVTRALCDAHPGTILGLRGPYGIGWGLEDAQGADLILAAGGIGLAPLRPVVLHALAAPGRYRRIVLLVGARTQADLLYPAELERWRRRGVHVEVTVDRAAAGWTGRVGLITSLIDLVDAEPARAAAFVCGPEVMMRLTARALVDRGVPADRVRLSLERNMRCGVGWCGHCQLGPLLLCRDGPVVPYERAEPLMAVKEL
ncbi:FAD/NAD(P)-binding protein [Actinomadura keratinilytica]|jgi:NAD(P)H-flavin reductase|uniref:FAD/NAD(P)-binding protein n=1 Tax=Actinomadura keratinilytica TaxID=547461 RepID=A0ABP7Z8S9_9ACTN